MIYMQNTTDTTKLTGGELAAAAEAITAAADEEARADRRFAAWQRRQGALVA